MIFKPFYFFNTEKNIEINLLRVFFVLFTSRYDHAILY